MGAFLAALVAGTTGFGDALVASVVWLFVLEPIQVTPLVVSVGLLIHVVPMYGLRHSLKIQRILPFLLPGLLGVPLGVWTVQSVDGNLVRQTVGWVLVAQSVWFVYQWQRAGARSPLHWGGRLADGWVGLVSGFLGGLSGLSGILPTLWSGLRGWTPRDQRAVYQSFIFTMHGATLLWLAGRGAVTGETGGWFLVCLPAVAVGLVLGLTLFRRLNAEMFRLSVQSVMLTAGIILIL